MSNTAGMVHGTPDWQMDMMYESESARMWEEQNEHDRNWDKMLEAVGFLNVALEQMNKVTDSLVGAKEEVENLPCEYKIGSLIESYEDLICEVEKIRQQFINGEG